MKTFFKNIFQPAFINIFLPLSIFLIAFITLSPFTRVGLVINDDLRASVMAFSNGFFGFINNFSEAWKFQGRINFLSSFWYYIPFAFDNVIYFKTVQIGLIISNILLLGFLFKKIYRNNMVFYGIILLGFVFIQNSWEHSPITAFPGFFSIPISLFFLSLIWLLEYIDNRKPLKLFLSILTYLSCLFSYELFIFYLPIYLILILFRSGKDKKHIKKTVLFFVLASALYLLSYFLFRLINGAHYVGVEVKTKINLYRTLKTVWYLTVPSIPSYFNFDKKYQYLIALYNNTPYFVRSIPWYLSQLEITVLIKAFFVFMASFITFKIIKPINNKILILIVISLSAIYFFIPAIPLSLTEHYQSSVVDNMQRGMPSTYFTFLSFVSLFFIVLIYVRDLIKKKTIKNIYLIFISVIIMILGIFVDITNSSITRFQVLSNYKWLTVNSFIKTEEYKTLPDNSVIYAPTLWNYIGSVAIHEEYWTNYFDYKSNKRIIITSKIESLSKSQNIYYLRFNQSQKDTNQYLVFSKINSNYFRNKKLTSDTVNIYDFSKYSDFYIYGKTDDISSASNIIVKYDSNKPTIDGNNYRFDISENNYVKEYNLKKIELNGKDLDLETIGISYK